MPSERRWVYAQDEHCLNRPENRRLYIPEDQTEHPPVHKNNTSTKSPLPDGLKEVPFLKPLTAAQWAVLERETREYHLADGEALCQEGLTNSGCQALYYVTAGRVMIERTSSGGRTLCVRILRAGDAFFTPALFDGGPCPATLSAQGEAKVWLAPRSIILPLILENPSAAQAALASLSALVREANAVVEGLAFKGNAHRLAALLLSLAKGGVIDRRLFPLDLLSSRTGTVPEVISRLLHQFADEGIIEITRAHLRIRDERRLQELASK